MSWVWENSKAGGRDRLVLLAIADSADHDGANAWPSNATLAHKCQMSPRTVQRSVQALVDLGELEVERQGGPSERSDRRPNRYRIVMDGASECHPEAESDSERGDRTAERGDNSGQNGVTLLSSYPSLDPSLDPSSLVADGDTPADAPAKRRERRTRIPDDWKPNDQHTAWAREQDVDLHFEFEQFRDFHGARGSVMLDWDKAFWTWLRKAKRWSNKSASSDRDRSGVVQAWEQVVTALQRGQRPTFDDRTESVIKAIGGWTALRFSENQMADRAHFIKFWEAS